MPRGRPEPDATDEAAITAQRLDKWIWHARFLRSRSDAAELVRKGRVRVNGLRVTQPGHAVKAGAALTLALPHDTRVVRVDGFAARRGNATEASHLFTDLTPQPQAGSDPGQT